MTRLSVNINKVALIRNSRLGNTPDLYQVAKDCERFGAHGITVHPRPDERHIRYADVPILAKQNTSEFNIEGYPSRKFLDLVISVKPDQCTLVPDPPGVLTSDTGWNAKEQHSFLKDVIDELHECGTRVSLFLNAEPEQLEYVGLAGADRIELYTGNFAKLFKSDPETAVNDHRETAKLASQMNIGINAGHDLNLDNLPFYKKNVSNLLEVSIGHALISDALYYGLQNTIALYLKALD